MATLTQNKIYAISEKMLNVLPNFLERMGIEYLEYPNRFSFPCPIHGGDNQEGCSIFTDGTTAKGNWQCWTKHCEEEFTNNIFGFIRGVVSQRRKKKISINETASFCIDFLGEKLSDISDDVPVKKLDILEVFHRQPEKIYTGISRETIRSKLDIPSSYFIKRGFLQETLNKFDVGLCLEQNKPMSNRAVAPIYDDAFEYVGCAGRAITDDIKPKWLYSKGFKKTVLYGLNLAKNKIKETQSIIIVEGQGDVWRLHEAGYEQSVGIFGCTISDDQLVLLENSGALNLIILTDSDEAGQTAYNKIVKKCGRRFNYYRPQISGKDVGEMTIEKLKEELEPQLKGVLNS